MLTESQIAGMFLVGFDGPTVTAGLRALLEKGVAGVILFGRNIQSAEQVAELCGEIKRVAGRRVLTCIDQEGGRVRRLREGFSAVPSMRALGRIGDAQLAREVGTLLARELRAVNIDVNFAPSLDVDTNPENPVIGDRSFGALPDLVARMGAALISGMQAGGVAACGKHFPGHGDTSQDSHLELPRLTHSLERLRQIELPPFKAAVDANVAMIMTSHIVFEAIDPLLPATLSTPVIRGILRRDMGFRGVIASDDLEMEAIAANYSIDEVVTRGTSAGVDLFAVCHDEELQHRAIEALAEAVRQGKIAEGRISQANQRIGELIDSFCARPIEFNPAAINSTAHQEIIRRINDGAEVTGEDPTGR